MFSAEKVCRLEEEINSQSLEDTQVGYILQKYSLDKYTSEQEIQNITDGPTNQATDGRTD